MLCSCIGLLVGGVSERGPAINQRPHQIHWDSIQEVWVLVFRFFVFLQLFPQVLLDIRPQS